MAFDLTTRSGLAADLRASAHVSAAMERAASLRGDTKGENWHAGRASAFRAAAALVEGLDCSSPAAPESRASLRTAQALAPTPTES